ncbi:hypothetical protein HJA87_00480 [Rhizobium bangladeshense]|uniref:TerB family tellurite resistance protein n=1 Tax=Rhizobium bangladeshense TaxID=1138189 RepID=A0ABS7LAX3_9HYPH|nr:hypothetical protein [Rhizobium bangladeshense]MBX4866378.1 hypothetical protein [Rhizobium bangladeshense]MBX4876494.1 hypothetical protein [Rhizobium bangladeshense]MBX4885517.1 hypothetical protein [Rhizobium bangladeshense]MBY3588373.1 hypothetical protein [Rhizobium bangladeshense]QSY93632.1 hypothetical protein J2J97_16730 [Rhizobium bangladeshense]
MAFLGILVAAVSGAVIWYWRFKMVREAGNEIIDSVERMRGAYKRGKRRKQAEAAPLASIADPAIAAVAFFFCLAKEKPMYADAAKDVIRSRMKGILRPGDMEEVLVFGEWASKNVTSPEDPIRRFRDLWMKTLDMEERQQLIGIAEDVAAVGGERTKEQDYALQTLRRSLMN